MTNSSSSDETADSKTLTDLFRLGEAIANEVGADDGVDTLGRWLSHHLAAQIEEAKRNPEKEEECTDLILRLWSHRAFYPSDRRPLYNHDELIATLDKLRRDAPYFLPSYDQTNENEEGDQWARLAIAVDRIARRLISFSLDQAVESNQLSEDPWLNLAKDLVPDRQIALLISLSETEQEDSGSEENSEASALDAFSDELEKLIKVAEEVRDVVTGRESH